MWYAMRVIPNSGGLLPFILLTLLAVQSTSLSAGQGASDASAAGRGMDALSRGLEPSPSPDTYLLDTGDSLHIRFFDRYDRDDLNGDYVVGESGQLRLPRIGSFDARRKLRRSLSSIFAKLSRAGVRSLAILPLRSVAADPTIS